MNYFPELCAELKRHLKPYLSGPVFVGFSGGLDSCLLLKAVCTVLPPVQVTAIHVHHGLSVHADQWAEFCRQQCASLGGQILVEHVEVVRTSGIEAGARSARYEVFSRHVTHGSPLLLAHHLDDQVETFFLRLMRGSGLTGLQGMAATVRRDNLTIVRPWLDFSRQQLVETAETLSLQWIEDESNQSDVFDRNYLRLSVLPMLEQRWPGYRDRIQRLIEQIKTPAESLAVASIEEALAHRLSHDGGLKWVDLDHWAEADKLTLLHAWLHRQGVLVPSQARLQSILNHVVPAAADAQPKVEIGAGFVSRHGPALYWVAMFADAAEPPAVRFNESVHWSGVGKVGVLTNQPYPALRTDLPQLRWALRCGGEVMRPYGRSKQRDLKRLMQEYRIKPWLRDRTPLLYSGDELVAIGDELLSAEHLCGESETGIVPLFENVD